ncbi:hypothetical protein [Phaeobacter inhibens]|uniref:hypothetical protein n=1 Tax=Phaeobacter inhibens TaxID=221822 RepID=UPI000CA1E1A6|nr:hypothetical protein [Phaeobacter inhibens]AUR06423.1 hypothetical protein PhaeoP59_00215 [Phaeobacter inhibens]AUR10220.1 hypothetical protein PhaeoP48_00201 [Phaeobacter inhibens]
MPHTLTIVIRNLSQSKMQFYAFQHPADYQSSGSVLQSSSASLATGAVLPYKSSGSTLQFQFERQPHVAAFSNQAKFAMLVKPQPFESAAQASVVANWPIALTPGDQTKQVPNDTQLTVGSLGLSMPVYASGIPEGNFGIQIPSYTPTGGLKLHCGNGIKVKTTQVVLSSYVTPAPVSHIFCAPKPKFYVKTGNHPVGSPISFSATGAALCDFTQGYSTCNVDYQPDGTFTVHRQ